MTQAPDFNTFDPEHEEAREAHVASTESAMKAAGVAVEEKPAVANYWGYTRMERHYLPDEVQYIEFQPMTEGDRQKYQAKTKTFLSMNRASGDSKMAIDPSKQRLALLEVSVKGWYMLGPDGRPAEFKSRQYGWDAWLQQADPKLISDLEKAIQDANPWLEADLDDEEIQKQIDELQARLEAKRERELGE